MYEFFDKIVCINLSTRPDKKSHVERVFKEIAIPNVSYYIAHPHPKGGRYGCFQSHIDVIDSAYREGCSNVLIFEDDIRPSTSYSKNHLGNAIDFLSSYPNVDILQLGHFPIQDNNGLLYPYIKANSIPHFDNIVEFAGTGAHAYCVTRSGMQKILQSPWRHYIHSEHFDIFLVHLRLKQYAYVPTLFDQHYCLGSDNVPTSLQESFIRRYGCVISKLDLNQIISKVKYHSSLIAFLLLLIAFAIFIIILYKLCIFYKTWKTKK